MNAYVYNRACPCLRCKSHALMGPAILITLGVIFLVDRHNGLIIPAALLIVIGLVKLLQANAPATDHVNPYVYVPQPAAPAAPQSIAQTEDRHV